MGFSKSEHLCTSCKHNMVCTYEIEHAQLCSRFTTCILVPQPYTNIGRTPFNPPSITRCNHYDDFFKENDNG